MFFLIYNMNQTEKSLAHSLIRKPMENTVTNLDRFFKPVENSLQTTAYHAGHGLFDTIDAQLMNNYFVPVITYFPQISSMGLANTEGYEYDVLPVGGEWRHRQVWIDKWGKLESWSSWQFDTVTGHWSRIKAWEDTVKHDPRERPWFQNALGRSGPISWTEPYIYNTTFQAGMTASMRWSRPGDPRTHIMAFDLTLADITTFTQQLKVSENGKVFVLSDQRKYIGLPQDSALGTQEAMNQAMLKSPGEVGVRQVSDALKFWDEEFEESEQSFEFLTGDDYWWGKVMKYPLSDDKYFVVGVIVPETDILSEVHRSKRIVIGSFIFVLILTGFVLYSYGQSRKANKQLEEKNLQIVEQKEIIEHAHNEVRASITYAERIQKALLSTDDYWQQVSPEHFILFLPRDVVSGDFYWAYADDEQVYWAAADCTGHGVPGAFMSMLGIGFLNEIVGEGGEKVPGRILDKLRFKIIQSLEQRSSNDQRKDGMDIAVCALNKQTMTLQYAGAYNPLFVVRGSGDAEPEGYDKKLEEGTHVLYEFAADKMPIGKHQLDQTPFVNRTIRVKPGDSIYSFSDGYQDQFGGPKGKKFMIKRMKKLILDMQDQPMEAQHEIFHTRFFEWIGEGGTRQLDDVCLVGIKLS